MKRADEGFELHTRYAGVTSFEIPCKGVLVMDVEKVMDHRGLWRGLCGSAGRSVISSGVCLRTRPAVGRFPPGLFVHPADYCRRSNESQHHLPHCSGFARDSRQLGIAAPLRRTLSLR